MIKNGLDLRTKQHRILSKITPEMRVNTQKKFDDWDEAVEKNLIEGTIPQKAYIFNLLADPTVYMYAFFKNKEGTPFKLYPYQDLIINDNSQRIIFAAANQIGKSVTLCCKALHFALTNPGKTVVMVSKTLPQSKDLLREIRRLLNTSTLDYKADIGDSANKTEIYFKHFDEEGKEISQSRIICVPATEAALGYAVNLLLIDELGFYDNGRYFYYQIAQPRTYETKGQIIVFSNPNGQQGVLWSLWNNKRFSKYQFNYLDKPGNTKEEYDKLCKDLTREEIDSTLDAQFTNPAGGFLTLAERREMQEERPSVLPFVINTPIYIFFDFAKTQDRTVRVIGIPILKNEKDWASEVYVYEMKEYPQGTPYTEIIDIDLKNLIKEIGMDKVAMIGWDNTGVGKGLEDFISRVNQLGIMAMPVEFSLQNKSRIYTLFKLLAENKRIKIPFIEECDAQLASLRFEKSSRGYLMVHHENERDRDDFPDALAGLSSLIIQPDNPPVTCEII